MSRLCLGTRKGRKIVLGELSDHNVVGLITDAHWPKSANNSTTLNADMRRLT